MARSNRTTFPPVAVTVDLIVLTIREDRLRALVVRRGEEPFRNRWALPGGFVRPTENLEQAARRELQEETGLAPAAVHLEQLASYGDPDRDPRMRVVTVAYLTLAADLPVPIAGTDAAAARWADVDELLENPRRLAFDHHNILRDGIERARAKLEYTPLGASFCPPQFTVAELRRVYEIVWGFPLDPRNFHRKVTGTPGFLEPTAKTTTRDGGRPARLYRVGRVSLLYPPMLRKD
ncbi:MAG TPA: NUDIX domain-containing protein [Candidatus Acidoferrum sp.]|nr:NUDIX domain-containing protein [Candidatus Acidoferrum sp.]